LAVADVNRQGNSVGYLLDDHGGHLGYVFDHIFVFST
jgi:predicted alpha/beta-fold hydrolase